MTANGFSSNNDINIQYYLTSQSNIKSIYVANRDTQDDDTASLVDMNGFVGAFAWSGTQYLWCALTMTTSGWYSCTQNDADGVGLIWTDLSKVFISEFMAFPYSYVHHKYTSAVWGNYNDISSDQEETGPLSLTSGNYPSQSGDNFYKTLDADDAYKVTLHTTYRIMAVFVFAAESDKNESNPEDMVNHSANLLVEIRDSTDTKVGDCYQLSKTRPLNGRYTTLPDPLYKPEYRCGTLVGILGNQVVITKNSAYTSEGFGFRQIGILADLGDSICDCGTVTQQSVLQQISIVAGVTSAYGYFSAPSFAQECPAACYVITASVPTVQGYDSTFDPDTQQLIYTRNPAQSLTSICEETLSATASVTQQIYNPTTNVDEPTDFSYETMSIVISFYSCDQTVLDDPTSTLIAPVVLMEGGTNNFNLVFPQDSITAQYAACTASSMTQCGGTRTVVIKGSDGTTAPTHITVDSSGPTVTIDYLPVSVTVTSDYLIYYVLTLDSGIEITSVGQPFSVTMEASCLYTTLTDYSDITQTVTADYTYVYVNPTDSVSLSTAVQCEGFFRFVTQNNNGNNQQYFQRDHDDLTLDETLTINYVDSGYDSIIIKKIRAKFISDINSEIVALTNWMTLTITSQSLYPCAGTVISPAVITDITITPTSGPNSQVLVFPSDTVSDNDRVPAGLSSCSGDTENSKSFLFQDDSGISIIGTTSYDNFVYDESSLSIQVSHKETTGEDQTLYLNVIPMITLGDDTEIFGSVIIWTVVIESKYSCYKTALMLSQFSIATVAITVDDVTLPVTINFPYDSISLARIADGTGFARCDGLKQLSLWDQDGVEVVSTFNFTVSPQFDNSLYLQIPHNEVGHDYEYIFMVKADFTLTDSTVVTQIESPFIVQQMSQYIQCDSDNQLDDILLEENYFILYEDDLDTVIELQFPADSNSIERLADGFSECYGDRSWIITNSLGVVIDTEDGYFTLPFETERYVIQAVLTLSPPSSEVTVENSVIIEVVAIITDEDTLPLFFELEDEYLVQPGSNVVVSCTVLDIDEENFEISFDGEIGICQILEVSDSWAYDVECQFELTQSGDFYFEVTQDNQEVWQQDFKITVVEIVEVEVVIVNEDFVVSQEQTNQNQTAPVSTLKVKNYNITLAGLITIEYSRPVISKVEFLDLIFKQQSEEDELEWFYNITEDESNYIKIQLSFERPLMVSAGWLPDEIIVNIPVLLSNGDETEGGDQGRILDQLEYLEVAMRLPLMVTSEEELVMLQQTAQKAGDLASSVLWIYIVLSLLLKGVMGMLWGLFQALQIITNYPLFMIKVPPNVLTIQAGFNKILNLEVIDKKAIYDDSLGQVVSDVDDSFSQNESDAKQSLGFGENNLLKQLLLLIFGLILFISIVSFICCCWKFAYPKFNKTLKSIFNKIKGKIMYNTILRTILQSYLGLGITTMFSIQASKHELSIQPFLQTFLVIFLVFWPFLTRKIVSKNEKNLNKLEVKESIGTLYLNQNTENVKVCKEYHMWYMYRRLVLALTIVWLGLQIGHLQVTITAYFSLLVIYYLIISGPFKKRHHNWLALFNEMSVYCSCMSMVFFTDFVVDPELRYAGGYMFLYWLYAFVAVNLLFMIYDLVVDLLRKLKRYRLHRKIKQERKNKVDQQSQIKALESSVVVVQEQTPQKKIIVPTVTAQGSQNIELLQEMSIYGQPQVIKYNQDRHSERSSRVFQNRSLDRSERSILDKSSIYNLSQLVPSDNLSQSQKQQSQWPDSSLTSRDVSIERVSSSLNSLTSDNQRSVRQNSSLMMSGMDLESDFIPESSMQGISQSSGSQLVLEELKKQQQQQLDEFSFMSEPEPESEQNYYR